MPKLNQNQFYCVKCNKRVTVKADDICVKIYKNYKTLLTPSPIPPFTHTDVWPPAIQAWRVWQMLRAKLEGQWGGWGGVWWVGGGGWKWAWERGMACGEGNGWVEFWVCIFCQGFKLKNKRNFASVACRVFRFCVFSSKVVSLPIASPKCLRVGCAKTKNAKRFASAQLCRDYGPLDNAGRASITIRDWFTLPSDSGANILRWLQ